jgi:hypothetical protein
MAEEYKKEYNQRDKETNIDKEEMETEIKSETQGSEYVKKKSDKPDDDSAGKDADFDKMKGNK